MDNNVTRNDAASRYELHVDGALVALADFHDRPGAVVVPHVETAAQHRGQGYAARLMDGVVADLQARDLQIVPVCTYAAAYMDEHPELAAMRAG